MSKRKSVDDRTMAIRPNYIGSERLKGKVALITGGDSGIGRAVAVHYAVEGASVAIVYRKSDDDAKETQSMVADAGQECLLFKGDISNEAFCRKVVRETFRKFKRLDILVNNAGTHEPADELEQISSKQFQKTLKSTCFPSTILRMKR